MSRGGRDDPGPVVDTRWYLSRLIQPPLDVDMKSWRTAHKKQNRRLQNDSDIDMDNAKR